MDDNERTTNRSGRRRTGHGGVRPGAGRKPGSGAYGEPTQAVRVPVRLAPLVRAWLAGERAPPPAARPCAPDLSALPRPLYQTRIAAGFPSPADDDLDEPLDLNQHLIDHPAATFFLRVQGDSMIGAGIHHGDLLVVDRAREPRSGAIVVAAVDGELTLKRLHLADGRVWLLPENPAYPPLEVSEGASLHIWGVVAHAVHSF